MPARRYSGAVLATIVVLVLVLVAVVARLRPAALALGVLGAGSVITLAVCQNGTLEGGVRSAGLSIKGEF